MASCTDDTGNHNVEDNKLILEIIPTKYEGNKELKFHVGEQIHLIFNSDEGDEQDYTFTKSSDDLWTCPENPSFIYSTTLKFEANNNDMPVLKAEASVAEQTVWPKGNKLYVELRFMQVADENETDIKTKPEGYDRAIYNRDDLLKFMREANDASTQNKVLSQKIIQMADVELKAEDEWIPIGAIESSRSFSGVYNGNGFRIANMHIDIRAGLIGMFGYVENATLCGINLRDCKVTYQVRNLASGILVGRTINSTITLCNSTGSVNSEVDAGGLIGDSQQSYISRCWSHATVSNTINYAGGLVGEFHYASVMAGCYAVGHTEGTDIVGMLAGLVDSSSYIYSCYANDGDAQAENGSKGLLIGKCGDIATVLCCWWPKIGKSPELLVADDFKTKPIQMPHVVVDENGYQALSVSTANIAYWKYWDLSKDVPSIDFSYNNE